MAELNAVPSEAFVDCLQKLFKRFNKCIQVGGDLNLFILVSHTRKLNYRILVNSVIQFVDIYLQIESHWTVLTSILQFRRILLSIDIRQFSISFFTPLRELYYQTT
jgi:hypothetical protein